MIATLLAIGLLLAQAPEPGATTSDLTPEARIHHQRGLTALDAGEFEASVAGLEQAYALLPDPLLHRDGRSKVMGSLRAALTEAHAETGDLTHLERLRTLLLAHDTALRQVEQQLSREATKPTPTMPAPAMNPVTLQAPRPALSPVHSPGRRRIAGGVLMGIGSAALGVMAYGIVVHVDDRHKLQSLTASIAASGARPTAAQDQEAQRYHERSDTHRSLAAITGALGGVALISGLALHVIGGKRAHTRLAPALGARFAGFTWRLNF